MAVAKTIRNFAVVILVLPIAVFAQGDPGDDPDAPLDGGLILLAAGGIGYGVKKAYDLRSKNKKRSDQ